MATSKVTITYKAPVAPVDKKVASICAVFEPTGSYIDTEKFAGTVYDTNVKGFGKWEGLVGYLGRITHAPNLLIMFHAAVRDGKAEFEEADAKVLEYIKELKAAFAEFGFSIKIETPAG